MTSRVTNRHTDLQEEVVTQHLDLQHPNPQRGHSQRHGLLLTPLVLGSLALGSLALTLASCGGGQAGDIRNRGPFEVVIASTGTGQLYPHRIAQADSKGNPTSKILDVSSMKILRDNLSSNNKVLPVGTWGSTAKLPDGNAGNQFLRIRFSHVLKAESILSSASSDLTNSSLTGAIQVLRYNPTTETTSYVKGRAFVGGYTYYDDLATPGLDLKLVKAVSWDGGLQVHDSRATGFPTGFSGADALVDEYTFTFIPDADDDLSSIETFPAGEVIRVVCSTAVLDFRNKPLTNEICTASTVGADTIASEVIGWSKVSTGGLQISPGNGQLNVDPRSLIKVNFSKPVQPRDVGLFFSSKNKTPQTQGVAMTVKVADNTFPVLYYGDPISHGDLCTYYVQAAYLIPGNTQVTLQVNNTVAALAGAKLTHPVSTTFSTGKGPGLVNAPVAPEAIYIGRSGSTPGVSVLDMNGFGQGTGDPTKSNFRYNTNIGQPGIQPNLFLGKSSLDGGGEGALTLTKDSQGKDLLIDSSVVGQVTDIHLGQPLDKIFNNGNINVNASSVNQVNPFSGSTQFGWGNSITVAPHPNPPKLVFPPPNPAMNISCEEPTLTSSTGQGGVTQSCTASPLNKLTRGNPFKKDGTQGLLYTQFPGLFNGPNPPPPSPQPPVPFCPYTSRQQIGHFLYVLDASNKRVLVLNSNRFQVLESITLPDPTSMSVSPNLKRLAVTNFSSGTVSFIDIDPASQFFHTVVKVTRVGAGPEGVAWQPEGEDCLVTCRLDNSVYILSGADLSVRKSVSGQINNPLEIAVTCRQVGANVGFNAGVYFAYILNGDGRGTVTIFESGPDGVNGIGFDDTLGVPRAAAFRNATTIQPDFKSLKSAIWVAHTDSRGQGQISHLELTSSQTGPIPITQNQGGGISLPPTFRERLWTITGRLGGESSTTPVKDLLSGRSPLDMAFDDLNNFGAYPDAPSSQLSNLIYADHSGKTQLKVVQNQLVASTYPRFAIIALGDSGTVDVVEIDTGKVVKTVKAPGVSCLSSYWRQ